MKWLNSSFSHHHPYTPSSSMIMTGNQVYLTVTKERLPCHYSMEHASQVCTSRQNILHTIGSTTTQYHCIPSVKYAHLIITIVPLIAQNLIVCYEGLPIIHLFSAARTCRSPGRLKFGPRHHCTGAHEKCYMGSDYLRLCFMYRVLPFTKLCALTCRAAYVCTTM